ncbi:MAG: hypothetical protein WD118_10385 [Phycisphaeraceae bacterium]
MNMRWAGLFVFILVLITVVSFTTRGCERQGPELAELRAIDVGGERVVLIKGRLLRDFRQAYYYQVQEAGEPVRDPAFFGTMPAGSDVLSFAWHAAEDGELVGLATGTDPREILVLHDFATGESWPAHDGQEMVEPLQQRGRSMLRRLAADHPDKAFTLRRAEGQRPLPTP